LLDRGLQRDRLHLPNLPIARSPATKTRLALHSPVLAMLFSAALAPVVTVPVLDASQVFRDYAPFVLRSVRRLGVGAADVEDAAQEVFLVVHRKLATFDGTSTVRTWLFGIALRVASDYRKRAHVRRERIGTALPTQSVEAEQPELVRRRQIREQLDRALDSLDDARRAVFVLYEMEGVPMAEVAACVGCPLFTAYSRLREARERIRPFFEPAKLAGDL
jgi:RNA polymerase sigma-70 factor, ECF subfamily